MLARNWWKGTCWELIRCTEPGLVGGQRCGAWANPAAPRGRGNATSPTVTQLQHHSQSSRPNLSCHHRYVTFCELWPARGHECSYFKVTWIPISSLVFSAQSFTSCAQYPPLPHGFLPFFYFSFYYSQPSFLLSPSLMPAPELHSGLHLWNQFSLSCFSAHMLSCYLNLSPHGALLLKYISINNSLSF